MKKTLITALLIACSAALSAQDKKMDKIADLYQKQDYENCIVYAKKYNASNSSNPKGYYYVGLSQFGQFLNSNNAQFLEPLAKTAKNSFLMSLLRR